VTNATLECALEAVPAPGDPGAARPLARAGVGIVACALLIVPATCLGILAATPPPVPEGVGSNALLAASFIALAVAAALAANPGAAKRPGKIGFLIAGNALLAAMPDKGLPGAQVAYLCALALLATVVGKRLRPASDAVARALGYASLAGLVSMGASAALQASGLAASLRPELGGRTYGVGYLGLAPAVAGLLVTWVEWKGRRTPMVASLLAQAAAFASCVVLAPPEWKWTAPYGVVAAGSVAFVFTGAAPSSAPALRRPLALFGLLAGALWALSPLFAQVPASPLHGGRVVFYNRGGLDWKTPTYDRPGAWEGGMFGLLPNYLRNDGFDVSFADSHESLDASLRIADVAVFINCDEEWTPGRRDRLRSFLAGGGRALFLGDHTDVFGLMRGLNSVLAEYGIEFEFDSAYHARDSWSCCTTPAYGSFYDRPAFPLVHAVGASLRVSWPARPLVIGRHAFSDVGVRENLMGSFLGNYLLDEGEPYGDVVLVACALESRLVVYGDTTAFQNGPLSESWPSHVRPLFHRLCGKRPVEGGVAGIVLSTVVAAAVLAFGAPAGLWVLGGAALGTALTTSVERVVPVPLTPAHALVDLRDAGAVGHYEARGNSIGPLMSGLSRNGLLPVLIHGDMVVTGSGPGLWVVVAPGCTPPPERVEGLLSYADSGGAVAVVGGGESTAGEYLKPLGMRPDSFLGECPPRRGRDEDPLQPRFRRAWSIEGVESTGATSLFRIDRFSTAAAVPRGRGMVAWIADSLYFSDANVEGIWGRHEGNVRWIRGVLELLLRRPASPVPERWRSPEMPR
jgi:hypothetical protein